MDADRFLTHSLQDPRITRILAAAIEAVEPGGIVRQRLEKTALPEHDRPFLLGIGKAAEKMTLAAAAFYKDFTDALIITKHSLSALDENPLTRIAERVTIMEAGHPVPDERSIPAGQAVLDFTSRVQNNDLLICLISGGGSALVVVPRKGLSLTDIQILTKSMLANGASIDEMNVLRCQLDLLKGGGLAAATKAKILSLILSDVIGDHLDVIASGLTVPSQQSVEKIQAILEKYNIAKLLSSSKLKIVVSEKFVNFSIFDRLRNVIVANNISALQAAKEKAMVEGFFTDIANTELQVVNGQTYRRAKKLGMSAAEYLSRNDSFPFFDLLGDLLKPGYTGTNVNDLIFLFGL